MRVVASPWGLRRAVQAAAWQGDGMSNQPDAPDVDPDSDPENLASKHPGHGGSDGPVDGAAAATPVQDDPENQDDPDADPEMLRSSS